MIQWRTILQWVDFYFSVCFFFALLRYPKWRRSLIFSLSWLLYTVSLCVMWLFICVINHMNVLIIFLPVRNHIYRNTIHQERCSCMRMWCNRNHSEDCNSNKQQNLYSPIKKFGSLNLGRTGSLYYEETLWLVGTDPKLSIPFRTSIRSSLQNEIFRYFEVLEKLSDKKKNIM